MKPTRLVVIAIAAVVALNVLVAVLDWFFREPSGPASSSFATTPDGLAAYASLLEELGHPVERLRRPLDEVRPDIDATVVVLDPAAISPAAAAALGGFAGRGGHVVAGGKAPLWLDDALPNAPEWSDDGVTRALPVADVPATDGVGQVRAAGEGSWAEAGTGEVVLAGEGDALLVAVEHGDGRFSLLADASPLQNRLLDDADNAAFGLALAGEGRRPVVFVESVHGYGVGTGLGALPERWRWTAAGLAVAVALWLWAKARRLGPAEETARALPPPRRAYVEALAATLARAQSGSGKGASK